MGAYAILLNATGQTQHAATYMNQARLYGMHRSVLLFFPL